MPVRFDPSVPLAAQPRELWPEVHAWTRLRSSRPLVARLRHQGIYRPSQSWLAREVRAGASLALIAQFWGVHPSRVSDWVAEDGLGFPADVIGLSELAAELGLSTKVVRHQARQLHLPVWTILRSCVVHVSAAQELRACFADVVDAERAAQLLDVEAAAAVLGLSTPQFRRRLENGQLKLRSWRCYAPGHSPKQLLFDPYELRAFRHVAFSGSRREMDSVDLARLLGLRRRHTYDWIQRGAPVTRYTRTPGGHERLRFDLDELAAWMRLQARPGQGRQPAKWLAWLSCLEGQLGDQAA